MTAAAPVDGQEPAIEPATGATSLLTVESLSVRYHGTSGKPAALDGLDLHLPAGRTVGLIGKSGSGKSTAAKAILSLLPPNAMVTGKVMFDGRDLLSLNESARRRIRWEKLALVPQAAMNAMDPVMAVDKQIAEVIRAHRSINQATAIEMAHNALSSVGIHEDRASSYPHQFSGGMRQRALIAMATVLEPTVLVADEPTTGLDVVVQDRILQLLEDAKKRFNLSLVIVTHDLGVANEMCDDIIFLEGGRTLASGRREDVLPRLRAATAKGSGSPTTRSDDTDQEPALEVEDLTVRYSSGRGLAALRRSSELTALEGVNLTVNRGEVVGLAGESGCGKSSLVSTLVGLTTIGSGVVRVEGMDIATPRGTDWHTLRQQVQMIFQDPYESLNPRLTVREAVMEPLIAQKLPRSIDREARVTTALENAGLAPVADYLPRYPDKLSGGERQRVAIARALVVEPSLILADEPVSMLDEATSTGVIDVLSDLAERLGVAVLLISHDVSLLRRVCDRIAIMYLGRIVEFGPTEQVIDSPAHPYTEALVRAIPSRSPTEQRVRVILPGEPPSLHNRPSGCAFHPRCGRATELCQTDLPLLSSYAGPPSTYSPVAERSCACWHPKVGAAEGDLKGSSTS